MPMPVTVSLATDTGSSQTDAMTSNGTLIVAGFDAGTTWEYQIDNNPAWTAGAGDIAVTGEGAHTATVRWIDTGRIYEYQLSFTLDTTAAAPALSLAIDSDIPGDGVTDASQIDVQGVEAGATWEYSLDSGVSWLAGLGTSFFLPADASYGLKVRQTDLAGNLSLTSALLAVTLNTVIAPGTAGNDTIKGLSGDDEINAGDGDDTITGFAGANSVDGGAGVDTLVLTETSTKLNAAGENQLVGVEKVTGTGAAAGVNIDLRQQGEGYSMTGSAFGDTLVGGLGNDKIGGGTGDDLLNGGYGKDTLSGGAGKDTLIGGSGNDSLTGAAGDDMFFGGSGNDALFGGAGNDQLTGGDGHDNLTGAAGNDTLFGMTGNDRLLGDAGDDLLSGGYGNDRFIYTSRQFGRDVIKDFGDVNGNQDVIQLSKSIYKTFAAVKSHMQQLGDDVVIGNVGGQDTITIVHMTKAALDVHDFVLV